MNNIFPSTEFMAPSQPYRALEVAICVRVSDSCHVNLCVSDYMSQHQPDMFIKRVKIPQP